MPTPTTQRIVMGTLLDNIELAKSAGSVLYLDARKATGSGLPTNSPLTSPWVDLSKYTNNATPANMAGTTASGVDVSNPIKPFWALDGTDDFFTLINTASLDITSAPLAVFATLLIPTTSQNGYVFCKNEDAAANVQYALVFDNAAGNFYVYIEGTNVGKGSGAAITKDVFVNVGWIWDGTNIKHYVNQVQGGVVGTHSGTLTSRSRLHIGCRGNAAGGRLIFHKGRIGTISVYSGAKCTESNVLRAEKAISKAYLE